MVRMSSMVASASTTTEPAIPTRNMPSRIRISAAIKKFMLTLSHRCCKSPLLLPSRLKQISRLGDSLCSDLVQMLSQPAQRLFALAVTKFTLQFLQREMNDVVVGNFFCVEFAAELKP